MKAKETYDLIRDLAKRDGRYAPKAFLFISEAIGRTMAWIKDNTIKPEEEMDARGGEGAFHVSGRELLKGIKKLAAEKWGVLAPRVFQKWGITRTEDFGEIVFLMVEDENMGWKKRECDTREDFAGGFDFDTVFDEI